MTDEANLERKKIMRETKKIGRNFSPIDKLVVLRIQIKTFLLHQGDDCAAKGVGFDGIDETDHDMLNEMLEQFHRESRTIPKRKTDVDRVSFIVLNVYHQIFFELLTYYFRLTKRSLVLQITPSTRLAYPAALLKSSL